MSERLDPMVITKLCFRPERSRPIWRNVHTGKEVVVMDLAINDHGGFQGGCRQFVVVTDEPPPPGPPLPPPIRSKGPLGANVYALWSFLQHWEPTGEYRPNDQLAWDGRTITSWDLPDPNSRRLR